MEKMTLHDELGTTPKANNLKGGMTEKKYREIILKMGGQIDEGQCVDFPDTFRINNKSEALEAIEVILLSQTPFSYAVDIETPLKAIKGAIKEGRV